MERALLAIVRALEDTAPAVAQSGGVLVVLSLALIVPLTAGDFDLSIASTLTLSAMLIAVLNTQHGWSIPASILAALAAGAAIGVANAGFILYFRNPSLIVTLGTGTFIDGLALWISDSNTIGGIDNALVDWVVGRRLLGVALCYKFDHTALGRRLIFLGRGQEVLRLSGIRVERVRFGCLVATGLVSAAARAITPPGVATPAPGTASAAGHAGRTCPGQPGSRRTPA